MRVAQRSARSLTFACNPSLSRSGNIDTEEKLAEDYPIKLVTDSPKGYPAVRHLASTRLLEQR